MHHNSSEIPLANILIIQFKKRNRMTYICTAKIREKKATKTGFYVIDIAG